jgi:hypothetical protein
MKKKAIYIYQSLARPGYFKIGKADQRVGQEDNVTIFEIGCNRINEQLTAESFGEYVVVDVLDITSATNSTRVEGYVHHKIQLEGYVRQERIFEGKKGRTEWFHIPDKTPEQVVAMVNTFIRELLDVTGLKTYSPRFFQQYVKEQVLNHIDAGERIIACELAPRFGKTLWSLDLFNTLCNEYGYQYMILPAYVLTAHSSFMKEVCQHADFEDIVLIDSNDADFVAQINDNKHRRLVITVSLHITDFEKLECLSKLDSSKKVSFIDEADFGAHTDSSKTRLDLIDAGMTILMTGTAIERATRGYALNAIVQWSYHDMLMVKKGLHPVLKSLKKVA